MSQVAVKPEGSREGFFEMLAALSPWRQVLAVIGFAVAVVGGLTLKVAWSFATLGWGALALVGGLIVAGIAVADRGTPDEETGRAQ